MNQLCVFCWMKSAHQIRFTFWNTIHFSYFTFSCDVNIVSFYFVMDVNQDLENYTNFPPLHKFTREYSLYSHCSSIIRCLKNRELTVKRYHHPDVLFCYMIEHMFHSNTSSTFLVDFLISWSDIECYWLLILWNFTLLERIHDVVDNTVHSITSMDNFCNHCTILHTNRSVCLISHSLASNQSISHVLHVCFVSSSYWIDVIKWFLNELWNSSQSLFSLDASWRVQLNQPRSEWWYFEIHQRRRCILPWIQWIMRKTYISQLPISPTCFAVSMPTVRILRTTVSLSICWKVSKNVEMKRRSVDSWRIMHELNILSRKSNLKLWRW